VVLGVALLLGEQIVPPATIGGWWPLIVLALTSQVVGQGLLVYALKHFPPLVIGLALLTQPVVAVAAGWLVFAERLTALDGLGMALVATGLVLARGSARPTKPVDAEPEQG
jgi:drug/metabolite transporter (DMT)-like permease